MNTFSVSRLALALAFGVTLTACSSTPPDQRPSDQTAPGTSSRPILSAKEAQNFDAQHYFASLTPGAAAWNPSPITLPAQPDFVVGPAGTQGVTHTTIQAAVDQNHHHVGSDLQWNWLLLPGNELVIYAK